MHKVSTLTGVPESAPATTLLSCLEHLAPCVYHLSVKRGSVAPQQTFEIVHFFARTRGIAQTPA